jgi:hypothetical protein
MTEGPPLPPEPYVLHFVFDQVKLTGVPPAAQQKLFPTRAAAEAEAAVLKAHGFITCITPVGDMPTTKRRGRRGA